MEDFLKITVNLIDTIPYYAMRMKDSSLNDSKCFSIFNALSMCITSHIAKCCNVSFVSRGPYIHAVLLIEILTITY